MSKYVHIILMGLVACSLQAQDGNGTLAEAHELAYQGKHESAKKKVTELLSNKEDDFKARALLARTLSWQGNYEQARNEFNKVLSAEKSNGALWASAIKNELYADENYIALGLAQKAHKHLGDNKELLRLMAMAQQRVIDHEYSEYTSEETITKTGSGRKTNQNEVTGKGENEIRPLGPKNRIMVDNLVTVFDQQFDPMYFSSVSYRRRSKLGSIIPRINFSNRLGRNGVQYDIDLYPRFLKRFYAYLNYGYSNSDIYPRQKMGGDIYVNLPGAIEFSAGGRYIQTRSRDISAITNSLGHYRGNYYFSLRSFISPNANNLTRVSGNLLVRKYLKDAENFFGLTVGMGISPELRQFFSSDETLLAETILFIETQRINFEYQFTDKSNKNSYRARIGVRRQELTLDSGSFFWGISVGLTYNVNF